MRTIFRVSLMAVTWLSQLAFASGEEPTLVVEKAIAVHGGKERLAGLSAIRMKAMGIVNLCAEVPFSWDVTWQSPKLLRIAAELDRHPRKRFPRPVSSLNSTCQPDG